MPIWTELLAAAPEVVTLPFLGASSVFDRARRYTVRGRLPPERGWHRFEVAGSRHASWRGEGEPDGDFAEGRETVSGYLVEDRLIEDGVAVPLDVRRTFTLARPVHLVEAGLDRFARALVARQADGALIFVRPELPLGPEPDVLEAFQDGVSIDEVPGVPPALHLAFLWQVHRREARERARREAEARAERERLRRSAVARRHLAATDFEGAARAALAIGGAELLDVRDGYARETKTVQFRFRRRRFECVVDRWTLRVVDAGICLIDHATDERGDARFTLESLVAVIDEAIRTGQLVVFRHA